MEWTGLRQVMLARNVTLIGLVLAVAMAQYFLVAPLASAAIGVAAMLLATANLASAWRLRQAQPVTQGEVLGQVLLDVAALTAAFYYAGGATNPFVDLYLVPVAVAAAWLPPRHALAAALAALAAYLFLTAVHVPLPGPRPGVARGFDCVGMWTKFALSAGFVGYLVFSLATRSRERERELREAQQRRRNEEYLVRAGSLAAGAAHELRSPLCTMAVVVNEILQQPEDAAGRASGLRLVSQQLEACRRILSEMMSYRDEAMPGDERHQPVDRFLHDAVEKWRMLRPGIALACRRQGTQPAPAIALDTGLAHAILNLLNNAADASPGAVEMDCSWDAAALRVTVLDRGPGMAPAVAQVAGERLLTTKGGRGVGIGLLLAKAAAQRAGGSLAFSEREGGGTCAHLVVPLDGGAAAAQAGASRPVEVRYRRSLSRA